MAIVPGCVGWRMLPPVAAEAAQASLENRINNYYSQFVSILCRRRYTLAPTLRVRV